MSQQIFAKIKRSSKYFGQGDGKLFKVTIDGGDWEYRVKGGPGTQYRLVDVNLYVVEEGNEIRIS